jgi:DNA (cytosine-5)-methyltransferase 1
MAFHAEGFTVVWAPDLIWGWDIKDFHPPAGVFRGVIGGPPCTGESQLAHLNGHVGYNLWSEAQRVILEAKPDWWVLEAVKKHEAPFVVKLTPRWLGERQSRKRYFHSNLNLQPHIKINLFENPEFKYAVRAANRASGYGTVRRRLASYDLPEACELQGLPSTWRLDSFYKEAQLKAVGNGVPLPVGREIARAVLKSK